MDDDAKCGRSLSWSPSASSSVLQERARILHEIRDHFFQSGVMEVETPCWMRALAPEPNIEPVRSEDGYLMSSPETALKRLLSAGSGSIYRMGPVFRQDESGTLHNPEFTMVEWYRVGWDLSRLMEDVWALVSRFIEVPMPRTLSYRQLFRECVGCDPFTAPHAVLQKEAEQRDVGVENGTLVSWDREALWDLLWGFVVEPELKKWSEPLFITEFPASRAAMSTTCERDGVEVAQRTELYVRGIELANGYQELTDALEQQKRFELVNRHRVRDGRAALPVDERFLAGLNTGMPDCAGVALGVDRLVMLALELDDIRDVIAFPDTHV
ncbi:MAG: EF-P lysine aminoacylase GenX [Magnetococcales bacterium]|nr:EF-P lysine aminoacylase GenX [Magnetococcales bacterium]